MRSFLCFDGERMKASVLPRRCSPKPVQLPTERNGTAIRSHCACAPASTPLSRLWCIQCHSVLVIQPSGWCCAARPMTWCMVCAVIQLVMNTLRMPPWNSASR